METRYFNYKPYFANEAIEIGQIANDNKICLFFDGRKHFYKVVPCDGVVYNIQKTQVKAEGGADGLYNWIEKATHHGEISESLVDVFIRKLIENCKPV